MHGSVHRCGMGRRRRTGSSSFEPAFGAGPGGCTEGAPFFPGRRVCGRTTGNSPKCDRGHCAARACRTGRPSGGRVKGTGNSYLAAVMSIHVRRRPWLALPSNWSFLRKSRRAARPDFLTCWPHVLLQRLQLKISRTLRRQIGSRSGATARWRQRRGVLAEPRVAGPRRACGTGRWMD